MAAYMVHYDRMVAATFHHSLDHLRASPRSFPGIFSMWIFFRCRGKHCIFQDTAQNRCKQRNSFFLRPCKQHKFHTLHWNRIHRPFSHNHHNMYIYSHSFHNSLCICLNRNMICRLHNYLHFLRCLEVLE